MVLCVASAEESASHAGPVSPSWTAAISSSPFRPPFLRGQIPLIVVQARSLIPVNAPADHLSPRAVATSLALSLFSHIVHL